MQALNDTLSPAGHPITAVFVIGGPARCRGPDIGRQDAARRGAEPGRERELPDECGEMHATPHGAQQAFGSFPVRQSGEPRILIDKISGFRELQPAGADGGAP